MKLYTAHLRVRTTLAGRGGPRRKSIVIRIVLLASGEADALARATSWFERERQLPTAGFIFGSGMLDSTGVELDHEKDRPGSAISVFENDGDVMIL